MLSAGALSIHWSCGYLPPYVFTTAWSWYSGFRGGNEGGVAGSSDTLVICCKTVRRHTSHYISIQFTKMDYLTYLWLGYIENWAFWAWLLCVVFCLYQGRGWQRSSFHFFVFILRGHHDALLRAALLASYRLNGPERLWHWKNWTPLLANAFWKFPVLLLVAVPLMLTDLRGFLKSQQKLV
jgi:hypothetical protein